VSESSGGLPRSQEVDASFPESRDVDMGVIYSGEDELIGDLLPALERSGDDLRKRLILIDNATASGVSRWESVFRETTVLRNQRSLGYAANLNRVLEAASARYVLLLNTDMQFEPAEQCVMKMVQFMDERPDCGISICRVYHADGSFAYPARRYQTLATLAARRLPLGGLLSKSLDRYLYRDRDVNSVFDCDWVSGCFMMLRRAAAADVGRFDVGFYKYFEDVDMCRRLHLAGWRVMYNGGTQCVHLEQRASKRAISRDGWLHLRAYVRWLLKWHVFGHSSR